MTSKIKKLKDLERKLTVSVPIKDYEKNMQTNFQKLNPQQNLMALEKAMFLMMFSNSDMETPFTTKS